MKSISSQNGLGDFIFRGWGRKWVNFIPTANTNKVFSETKGFSIVLSRNFVVKLWELIIITSANSLMPIMCKK